MTQSTNLKYQVVKGSVFYISYNNDEDHVHFPRTYYANGYVKSVRTRLVRKNEIEKEYG